MNRSINYFALILVILCAVLWVAAPFMAVNMLTLHDQPTALQLVRDDVIYLGNLYESDAFRLAAVVAGGLVLCLIGVLLKSGVMTRLVSLAELGMMGYSAYLVCESYENLERLEAYFGIGFAGIAAGFLLLLLFGGSGKK